MHATHHNQRRHAEHKREQVFQSVPAIGVFWAWQREYGYSLNYTPFRVLLQYSLESKYLSPLDELILLLRIHLLDIRCKDVSLSPIGKPDLRPLIVLHEAKNGECLSF